MVRSCASRKRRDSSYVGRYCSGLHHPTTVNSITGLVSEQASERTNERRGGLADGVTFRAASAWTTPETGTGVDMARYFRNFGVERLRVVVVSDGEGWTSEIRSCSMLLTFLIKKKKKNSVYIHLISSLPSGG